MNTGVGSREIVTQVKKVSIIACTFKGTEGRVGGVRSAKLTMLKARAGTTIQQKFKKFEIRRNDGNLTTDFL